MSKKLSPIEAAKMEQARLLIALREAEAALITEKRKGLDARQQILQLTIANLALERRALHDEMEKVKANRNAEKESHETFLASVRKRLKLPGKFGYHPDTLEIVEEGNK